MAILIFEIDQIPDLTLNKYQSIADTGIEGLLLRHENFLRQWHGIGIESGISLHLLYIFTPSESIGKRLKLFFILQGDPNSLSMVKPLINSSPLSEFYQLKIASLPSINFDAGSTLTKKERIADIYNPLNGQISSIHYVPEWKMNSNARLYDVLKIMETLSLSYVPNQPCAFRIDIYPASMSQRTRECFNPVLKSLRGGNDVRILRDTESIKGDNYARDICTEYEDWLTNIETTPHFRVNLYAFSDTLFKSKVILNAAGAESISEGDFSIASIKADSNGKFNLLSRMDCSANDYCFFPKQASLKSWSTTFCLGEAVPFFRFPVLFDGETLEIPKETAPLIVKDGIHLGEDIHKYPVNLSLEDLPRHAFFTGMPGSGKTNTMLHIVTQLKKHHIPFLALEPAKKEYRALLGHTDFEDVFLFSPHLQSRFPLHMNPLEFPRGVRLSEHINALMEVFSGSFSLEGPTYRYLCSAIQKSYFDLGWNIEDVYDSECQLTFPSFQCVYDNLESEIESSSYDREIKGNVRAFLQVRLGGLMERDAGQLFNTNISTLQPEEWLKVSAIVELEVLNEQAKNFFVLLVSHYILESLRVDPNGGVDESGKKLPVRHAIFIEEAHNIIASSSQQNSSDTINPKISATAYIVKMLAEVRALRESIIIADQLPTALTAEVTKNTGLKVVHRLTARDDRSQIGMAINATSLQLEQIASFTSGKALIYHEKTLKPFEVQIAEWKAPNIDYDLTDDEQLYRNILTYKTIKRAILSSVRHWNNMCVHGKFLCNLMSNFFNAYMSMDFNDVDKVSACKAQKEQLIREYNELKKKHKRLSVLWYIDFEELSGIKKEFDSIYREIEESLSNLQKFQL